MQVLTKVAGVWRKAKLLFVKVAGTWKPVRQVYVKISGVWKATYSRANIEINALGLVQTVMPSIWRGVWYNRNQHLSGVAGRSYTLGLISKDGFITTQTSFDIHADSDAVVGGNNAALMASKLSALADGQIFFIVTYDEPKKNRLLGGLPSAMYRVGVSQAIFENINYRGAYFILGKVGSVPYYENYIGVPNPEGIDDGDPRAAISIKFYMEEGVPTIYQSTPIEPLPTPTPTPTPTPLPGGGGDVPEEQEH